VKPTPFTTLKQAQQIGLQEGLHYVYVGNITNDGSQDTYCPKCGSVLIQRPGYWIVENKIQERRCPSCGTAIASVWHEIAALSLGVALFSFILGYSIRTVLGVEI
jgi:pyruvate formate lyase activating enzyme